jgi:hypothetical protein
MHADPYLYFLDISGGTKDFGLTRGEKVCSLPRLRVCLICSGPCPQPPGRMMLAA